MAGMTTNCAAKELAKKGKANEQTGIVLRENKSSKFLVEDSIDLNSLTSLVGGDICCEF